MKSFRTETIAITQLADIPSGSGICFFNKHLYIIGDDATMLYKLDPSTKKYIQFPVTADTGGTRIEKAIKHDYESLEVIHLNGKPHLMAFGSGSLQPYRDSLLLISCEDETRQRIISLDKLYKLIKEKTGNDTLNIEGVAISNDNLFLMDRENDLLCKIGLREFESFIGSDGKNEISGITLTKIELPALNNLSAGISGGCRLDDDHILFVASLENTSNPIDDGEVFGSYIGVISLGDNIKVMETAILIDKNGQPVRDKLESIEIIERMPDGKLKVFAIADNDDGSSKLYELIITVDEDNIP